MINKRAFEKIFHEHYSPLCNYAAKMVRDFGAAEEIVQDLFVKLLDNQALDRVEHIDRFLIRSVKFRCIDFLRRKEKLYTIPLEHLEENDLVDGAPDSEEEMNALFSITWLPNFRQKRKRFLCWSDKQD